MPQPKTRIRARPVRRRTPPKRTVRRKLFKRFGKIKGTLELQKICKGWGIQFEPARLLQPGQRVTARMISGCDRVLIRYAEARNEFVLKGKNRQEIQKIADEISASAAKEEKPVILQKVGLREDITHHGGIRVCRNPEGCIEVKIGQSEYSQGITGKKTDYDVFGTGTQPSIDFLAKRNRIAGENARAATRFFGNRNAPKFLEELAQRTGTTELFIRFVRYKRGKPVFYDMTSCWGGEQAS